MPTLLSEEPLTLAYSATFGAKPSKPRSSSWPAVEKAHLAKFPSCACCGRKSHLQVHHKKPFHLRPELELDPDNLITLCEPDGFGCHLLVGHLMYWPSYNPSVEEDAKAMSKRIADRPATGEA